MCVCVCVCVCDDVVLVMFYHRKKTRRVRELWWLGLPPGVRGDVWKRAIGNDLNISPGERVLLWGCDLVEFLSDGPELYQISLSRCRERLASMELSRSRSGELSHTSNLSLLSHTPSPCLFLPLSIILSLILSLTFSHPLSLSLSPPLSLCVCV